MILGGVKTKCVIFALRRSHSGRAVHRVYPTQALEAFLKGHIAAFEELGGVPTVQIKYDNLSAAVTQVLAGRARVETARRGLFGSHYGFDACRQRGSGAR